MSTHDVHLHRRARLLAGLVLAGLLLSAVAAAAAPHLAETVARVRHVLGSGATAAEHVAGVRLRGTVGQPLVGAGFDAAARVALRHGFWAGAPPGEEPHDVYLPLVLRLSP